MIPLQAQPADGFVAELLARLGVPDAYAGAAGSAITFVVVFVVLYVVGKRLTMSILERALRSRELDEHARKPIRKLASILVVFAAVAIAFGLADYGDIIQSLATVAAAATLAIGFALQDVLKNFAAGLFIFTDRPFRIGDWIEWDGHAGIVEDISLRVTRVRTFDNELLTVPNSTLTDGVIKNPVAKEQLRFKVLFGIGYGDDVDLATDIILDEAERHDEILDDPAPSVRLVELGDSSVGLQSRVWVGDPSRSDVVKVRGEYVKAVKDRFDEAGIDIPYPTRTLEGGLDLSSTEGLVEAADD